MGASEHFVSLYVHLSPLECIFFLTIDALLTLSFVADDRPAVGCKRAGSVLKGAAAACRKSHASPAEKMTKYAKGTRKARPSNDRACWN
jgi:hypothetical protein